MTVSDTPPSERTPQLGTCPICRKPADSTAAEAPFCSSRCKMVDLGRWFEGRYVVAGEDAIELDPEFLEAEFLRLAKQSIETKRAAEGSTDADDEGGSTGSAD